MTSIDKRISQLETQASTVTNQPDVVPRKIITAEDVGRACALVGVTTDEQLAKMAEHVEKMLTGLRRQR